LRLYPIPQDFPLVIKPKGCVVKTFIQPLRLFFFGTKSTDILVISFFRESKLLDKFLSSILRLFAFSVDFCAIKIVFTAIIIRAAAEVLTQYLIIFFLY
tara:strand:- start:157 stop:453 length:297 start_codon:yes stop_codon:yes gene_type:complete